MVDIAIQGGQLHLITCCKLGEIKIRNLFNSGWIGLERRQSGRDKLDPVRFDERLQQLPGCRHVGFERLGMCADPEETEFRERASGQCPGLYPSISFREIGVVFPNGRQ